MGTSVVFPPSEMDVGKSNKGAVGLFALRDYLYFVLHLVVYSMKEKNPMLLMLLSLHLSVFEA